MFGISTVKSDNAEKLAATKAAIAKMVASLSDDAKCELSSRLQPVFVLLNGDEDAVAMEVVEAGHKVSFTTFGIALGRAALKKGDAGQLDAELSQAATAWRKVVFARANIICSPEQSLVIDAVEHCQNEIGDAV